MVARTMGCLGGERGWKPLGDLQSSFYSIYRFFVLICLSVFKLDDPFILF
jgi:hypothetical protein